MKKWKKKIEDWCAGQEETLVERISQLVAVPSVGGPDAGPGKPFGEGPAAVLQVAVAQAAEAGLKAQIVDGYVMTADVNDQPDGLHILAHLDIVTPGDGWDTDPYRVTRKGDLIFGRGVDDDKGPAAAAMLAMECVKALKIPLRRNVKLVLGTDEESGSRDIAYYYQRVPYAPATLSPDAQFPVINIEKGRYAPVLTRTWPAESEGPRVIAFHGGVRANVVPRQAEAEIQGLSVQIAEPLTREVARSTGTQMAVMETPGGIHTVCIGKEAHASKPDEGNNAITALLALLTQLPLASTASREALRDLACRFPHGDNHGTALGIDQTEAASGRTTVTLSLLELNETGVRGQFDARTPLCVTEKNGSDVVERVCHGFNLEGRMTPPHQVEEQSPFVQTLLRCYEEYTGRPGRCVSMGGGTYVHDIPGGVAFGAGDVEFDSHLHSANERARVSALLTAAKIYVGVIAELCGET